MCGFFFDRVAYCFYVVCFISSIGMTMFMCMSTIVVGTCGQNRNFSHMMGKDLTPIISCG